MATRTTDFLRRGARIHSLAFATSLARNADRPYDVTWEQLRYRRADREGTRGTVLFSKAGAIGVFFDPRSPQAPANMKKPYRLELHFEGIPDALMQLARREVLDGMEMNVGDATVKVVTSAFWSNPQGELVGARAWPRLLADGAHLMAEEMLRPEAAITKLSLRYGFSKEQTDVLKRHFAGKAKEAASNARVVLPAKDRMTLGLLTTQTTRDLLAGAAVVLE